MMKEVDEKGYYVHTKDVVVEFILDGISELDLNGFSGQNVIFGLSIEKGECGFRITLDPCHGLTGTIDADKIVLRLTAGKPSD